MTETSRTAPKIAEFDVKHSLLETFTINRRPNQKLIESLSDAAWHASPPSGKSRTIAGIARHIHNVRLMWLGAADRSAKLSAKLGDEKASRKNVMEALSASAKLVQELLEKGLRDQVGKVPNFKPDLVAFTGYLIAHDSHHRGQISMLARQMGCRCRARLRLVYGSGERCGKSAGSNVDASLDVGMVDGDFGTAAALLVTSGGYAAILQTAMENFAIRHCALQRRRAEVMERLSRRPQGNLPGATMEALPVD
jgi:uncharacterized damage-inducible protein DinB